MKTTFRLMVMVMLCSCVAGQSPNTSQGARSPEAVIKEFYQWYIRAQIHGIDPYKGQGRVTLKKYVTLRFIREIDRNEKLPEGEGFDADYFLQTQDPLPSPDNYNKEAEWKISISNVVVRGTTAKAIVTLRDGYPRVGVTLVKEGATWKINKVTNKPLPGT